MDVVQGFATLFLGSQAAFGTEEGGCDKDQSLSYFERVCQHLDGDRPMGVYPLAHMHVPSLGDGYQWLVHWGCVDFDEGEERSLAYALNVAQVIRHMGGRPWVERSRSKGYHVWLFLQDWYPAVLVREALLGACQVVDAPTKEINPKSIELAEGQLGNYVRLPYPGWLETPLQEDRRVMIEEEPGQPQGETLSLTWFVDEALKTRAGQPVLDSLRSLYEPPKRVVVQPARVDLEGDIYKRMGGLAWTIYQDGPIGDGGRGHTLFKMACLLAEGGKHTQGEALSLCIEADQRWGKFHERINGDETIAKMVSKAYGTG